MIKNKKRLTNFHSSKELSYKITNELLKIKINLIISFYMDLYRNNWLGIRNATVGLFPDNSAEIPQVFSNPILRKKHQVRVCNEIIKSNFQRLQLADLLTIFLIDRPSTILLI